MLEQYFLRPDTVDRIRGSFLGAAIERYVTWLSEHGYKARCVLHRVPLLVHFGEFSRGRGATGVSDSRGHVDAFVKSRLRRRSSPCRSRAARQVYIRDVREPIEQFAHVVCGDASSFGASVPRPFAQWAPGFFAHLGDERGLSKITIYGYEKQLASFERYVLTRHIDEPGAITPAILDGFLAERRTCVSARSLGSTCASLRSFLRYLFREGSVRRDLSLVVDGPRTYSLSEVPRSVTRDDVDRTLAAIDRRSIVGRRDYAMMMLLVAYGLRAREVAALTLDDVDWRACVLHVRARKAGHEAVYPLATEVGDALLEYLQRGRPETTDRHLFFRAVAPRGAITHRVVSCRAKHYLQKAGVDVPRPGSHTLRHSCAQRLVDAEFSLKVVGDYLGHRSASSTRIYSKVAIGALREVALGDGEAIL